MAKRHGEIATTVANQQSTLKLPSAWLRNIVHQVLSGEKVTSAKISIALVSDSDIQRIHRQFLQHDVPTDVITFPYSARGASCLTGEIVISTDTAQAVATEFAHPAENEVALYLIHGLLHLCGYDDHDPHDREAMRKRESHYLELLSIKLKDYPSVRKQNPAAHSRAKKKRRS